MQNSSNESITEALKLLEEAAMQKKDELKTVMSGKFTNLQNLFVESGKSAAEMLTSTKDRVVDMAVHAEKISVEKARELSRSVDKCVHQNPWPYIVGTAVTGIIFGYFLRRKRN